MNMLLVENSSRPLLAQDDKILRGLFAEMGTFNQNGRRYPEDIYEQAYNELVPKIKEKRLLGELDHPMDYDEVRLANVSHAITECEILDDHGIKKVYGAVELLDTPSGLIAQALVKAGIPIGISSRGLGSTQRVREGDDVTELKLITYDLVADPSFANAILSPEKTKELSDSLDYIESKLPLNESSGTQPVRDKINQIRESLISKKTAPTDEIDINRVEIDSLKGLLESAQSTIQSDTEHMMQSRRELKSLRQQLQEANKKNEEIMKTMFKLQDAYNALVENTISKDEIKSLNEELVELRKQLAVEKRGMSYANVSELLEGATTEEDIESRLSSLSSLGRNRQTKIVVDETLTESIRTNSNKSRLASIVSKV